MITLNIRSISKTIYPIVAAKKFHASVIAAFENSCDLETQKGVIIAVVNPDIGNGPFHLVLDEPAPFSDWSKGTSVDGDGRMVWISIEKHAHTALCIEKAEQWDPMPNWHGIRDGERLMENLLTLKEILISYAPEESLPGSRKASWKGAAQSAINCIENLIEDQNLRALPEAIGTLCGLGPGLTPSGDDWLAGWLLGLRLEIDKINRHFVTRIILEEAKKQTNKISQAFLNAAARGEAVEPWHALLESLARGKLSDVEREAIKVMHFGATSGADMLAGFTAAVSRAAD